MQGLTHYIVIVAQRLFPLAQPKTSNRHSFDNLANSLTGRRYTSKLFSKFQSAQIHVDSPSSDERGAVAQIVSAVFEGATCVLLAASCRLQEPLGHKAEPRIPAGVPIKYARFLHGAAESESFSDIHYRCQKSPELESKLVLTSSLTHPLHLQNYPRPTLGPPFPPAFITNLLFS